MQTLTPHAPPDTPKADHGTLGPWFLLAFLLIVAMFAIYAGLSLLSLLPDCGTPTSAACTTSMSHF